MRDFEWMESLRSQRVAVLGFRWRQIVLPFGVRTNTMVGQFSTYQQRNEGDGDRDRANS